MSRTAQARHNAPSLPKALTILAAAALFSFNAACTAQMPASGRIDAPRQATPALESTPSSTAAKDASPSSAMDIRSFVPADFDIRMEKHADLDNDGHEDTLLVLQEKDASDKASRPRTLIIIGGAADGHPSKLVENPNAILCASCGGMMGDPLAGITLNPGRFTILFEGGSRELWSREYDFRYAPKDRDWLLDSIVEKSSDRITGEAETRQLGRKDFGTISIRTFDPENVPSTD